MTILIDSEVLASSSPSGLIVYPETIQHWEPPYQSKEIDDAQRQRIMDNIRRAFRFQGYEIET